LTLLRVFLFFSPVVEAVTVRVQHFRRLHSRHAENVPEHSGWFKRGKYSPSSAVQSGMRPPPPDFARELVIPPPPRLPRFLAETERPPKATSGDPF
jgi:hypothetical protein